MVSTIACSVGERSRKGSLPSWKHFLARVRSCHPYTWSVQHCTLTVQLSQDQMKSRIVQEAENGQGRSGLRDLLEKEVLQYKYSRQRA